ncbi:MAG TPA: hypothetical protein P5205_19790 [Candidatus Paceibacterota bacterium]|nr:hypothetical protein [Verrucomicrobiota bacterium]HSA12609.1 hypothetical protein [Candidatus Paceibacterota bacterium]
MPATVQKPALTWPLLIFLLCPSLARAETAVQAWVQRYNGPGNFDDYASAVAVDGSNNVVVTGTSDVSEGASNPGYVTIKYSSAGVPLWTNRYNGPGNGEDHARDVAPDGSDNVIVTGNSRGSGGVSDYATIKYSSEGVPLWTNRYNGPGNFTDGAQAVAVDGSNNVIVTGVSTGSGSASDYATIKYSGEGVPLWTNRYNGPANDYDGALAVAVDGSNNVIVTGASRTTTVWPRPSAYATIKYSSAGVPLWTNRYHGPVNDDSQAVAVAVDGSSNVIVTGYSLGDGSSYDYATIKYSSAGMPLWTNRYNGPGNYQDKPYAVGVDAGNNVIVTGCSTGTGADPDGLSYATIKYSSAGVPLWTNRYHGPGNGEDYAYDVAVDGSDNVIVTGRSTGTGADPDGLSYATIKYSSAGVPLWTNRYNGPGSSEDQARKVTVDHSGNVIVTGRSLGAGSRDDFATIKYAFPLVITDFRLTNDTFQMLLDNLQPGTLVIEAATSPAATPPDWSPVFTNTTPTNVLFYTDSEAATSPTRFYRAFQSP